MLSVEQLIEESRTDRLHSQPLWVRTLVHELARSLEREHVSAERARSQAEREVDAARALLTEGPAGSDTFMDLPRTLAGSVTDEYEQRPLGTGVSIEFRRPEDGPGEGIDVKFENGRLRVGGLNHLAVVPVDARTIYIETR